MDSATLDQKTREELIAQARTLGVERAELMTRVELRDEIVRRTEHDPNRLKRSRGWLGAARDLVADVVEAGLNLPDAAAIIRGEPRPEPELHAPAPVATVTLAEIYVAQGHPERALEMVDQVLQREPDHAAALALRARLRGASPEPALEPKKAAAPRHEAVPTPEHAERAAKRNGMPSAAAAGLEASDVLRSSPEPELPSSLRELHGSGPNGSGSVSSLADTPLDSRLPETVEHGDEFLAGTRAQADSAPPDSALAADAFGEGEFDEISDSDIESPPSTTRSGVDSLLGRAGRSPLPAAPAELERESGVAVIRHGAQGYVYWELAQEAWAELQGHFGAGGAWVQMRGFAADVHGIRAFDRDLAVEDTAGGVWVPGVPNHGALRVALGFREGERFLPFCVGTEIVLTERGEVQSRFRPRVTAIAPGTSFEDRALRSYRAARALR